MPDLYASLLAARSGGDLTIAAGQAGVAALDDFLASLPTRALALSDAQLQLSADQAPGTLTVDGDLAGAWLLPGLDTQTLAVQHATITYSQPSAGATVTAGLSIAATLTAGADTVGLTGTLGQQSDLAFAWSAGAPGGTLSLGDALSMATDGRSSFEAPAGIDLFAAMTLSSAAVSVSYAGSGWTTMDFTLAADPSAVWNVGTSALKQIGATFTAVYNLQPDDFHILFGGKIFATFDLGQEFGVAVGLSPSDVWELDLTAEDGLPALESLAALIGADEEVRTGLAAVGLGDIALTAVRIGVNRIDNSLAFFIMQGSISVAGTPFDVFVQLPDFAFGATLPDNATISLAALLSFVLGETGGLPDVVVSELELVAAPADGSFSVLIAVADQDIVVGSYGLAGVTLSLAKQGSEASGGISATISLAGATVQVEGAYAAGWSVSGKVDQLSLPALIAEVLPGVALPPELASLNLVNVSASWNITTGSFAFTDIAAAGLPVRWGDAEQTLPPGYFDCAVLLESFEHIRAKQRLLEVLAIFAGRLVMRVNCQDLSPPTSVFAGTMHMISSADLRSLLETAGWRIEHWRDRRAEALPSAAAWHSRAITPGLVRDQHLDTLQAWSGRVLMMSAQWAAANPLIEVIAEPAARVRPGHRTLARSSHTDSGSSSSTAT